MKHDINIWDGSFLFCGYRIGQKNRGCLDYATEGCIVDAGNENDDDDDKEEDPKPVWCFDR